MKNNDYNEVNIFLSHENPCTFLLARRKDLQRSFNTISELSQNHIQKQFILPKTAINWQFNDI